MAENRLPERLGDRVLVWWIFVIGGWIFIGQAPMALPIRGPNSNV
jgi:hypothetical protein